MIDDLKDKFSTKISIFKYPIYCNTEINDTPRKYPNHSIVQTDMAKPVHQTVELKDLK